MRNLYDFEVNRFRVLTEDVVGTFGTAGDHGSGVFLIQVGQMHTLLVLASSGDGWDHVSVSASNRCPIWAEMELIKRLFFRPDEVAMQLHVPPNEHINCNPYVLHLWRPQAVAIPRPDGALFGGPDGKPAFGPLASPSPPLRS